MKKRNSSEILEGVVVVSGDELSEDSQNVEMRDVSDPLMKGISVS